jgi:CTD kinase subunit gamma
MPLTDDADDAEELTIDIEFENGWEATSDWNEDDDEAVAEENDMCYPRSTTRDEAPMDIS